VGVGEFKSICWEKVTSHKIRISTNSPSCPTDAEPFRPIHLLERKGERERESDYFHHR